MNSSFNNFFENEITSKNSKPNLSLHERQIAYYKKRNEIFNGSSFSNSNKILKIRFKSRQKRKFFKAIDSTLLQDSEDDRGFLSVKIGAEYLNGLVDSGANITCLGNGSIDFLELNNFEIIPLNASLRTAGGNSKDIIGYVNVEITFRKSTSNNFFISI